jgi:hypothetical protein
VTGSKILKGFSRAYVCGSGTVVMCMHVRSTVVRRATASCELRPAILPLRRRLPRPVRAELQARRTASNGRRCFGRLTECF